MSDAFTEEQLEEFKETFSLFDKEGDGSVAMKEVSTILRALGQHPTEAELAELVGKLEAEGQKTMEFPAFLNVLSQIIKETDPESELTAAFKVFDKESTGNITSADLRHVMTSYGEVLNDEEIEEMIKEADTDADGIVDYQEFIDMIIQR